MVRTKYPIKEIIEIYQSTDISLRELAKLYNTCHQTIGYLLKKSGIPIKPKGQMISLAWKNKPHPRLGMKGPLCPVYGYRHSEETKEKMRERMLGRKNPQWKNGKTMHPEGYILVTVNGEQVLEHRLVVEKMINRKLTTDEIVHHINEDKTDNRPENLVVTTRSEHIKTHKLCGRHTA